MSYERISLFACNPSSERLKSIKLSSNDKGEKVVYTNARTIIIRDIEDQGKSVSYAHHTSPTTLARLSPTGHYCASADTRGCIKIFSPSVSLSHDEQPTTLKLDTKALSGRINDLAWDQEGKRMIVGGEGREAFGRAFFVDGGASCGEIQGSSKAINAVSIRPQRPYRAVTASDDGSIGFYHGVPFRCVKIIRTHTRFVQDIKYSPSGSHFASVGSDGMLFLYEGQDGEKVGEMTASAGSVLGVGWSPDSRGLCTSSADGCVKIWDAETQKPLRTYTIGTDVASQQNGNVWANEHAIVSLGLDGVLNVIDPRIGDTWRKIHGAPKGISATVFAPRPEPTFYTGSFDGAVRSFELPLGTCSVVPRSRGDGQVTGLTVDLEKEQGPGEEVWATGWGAEGGLQVIKQGQFSGSIPDAQTIDGSKSIAASQGRIAIADVAGVTLFENDKKVHTIAVKDGASAVALNGDHLAFGGTDKKIHLTSAKEGAEEIVFDDSRGEMISLAFSGDAKYLAGGDSSGRIVLIDVKEKKTLVSSKWTAHTSRVNSLHFSPDGLKIVSGGLDESIYVWSVQKTLRNVPIKNAHAGGVTGVSWLDDKTIISAGADACVRTWSISGI